MYEIKEEIDIKEPSLIKSNKGGHHHHHHQKHVNKLASLKESLNSATLTQSNSNLSTSQLKKVKVAGLFSLYLFLFMFFSVKFSLNLKSMANMRPTTGRLVLAIPGGTRRSKTRPVLSNTTFRRSCRKYSRSRTRTASRATAVKAIRCLSCRKDNICCRAPTTTKIWPIE